MTSSFSDDDPLAAARAIVVGLAIMLPLWALILLAIWGVT